MLLEACLPRECTSRPASSAPHDVSSGSALLSSIPSVPKIPPSHWPIRLVTMRAAHLHSVQDYPTANTCGKNEKMVATEFGYLSSLDFSTEW